MAHHTPVPLSAQAVIELSDAAATLSSARWSDALIRAGFPALRAADLSELPLGSRDGLVVTLRRALRGANCECEPKCESCGEKFALNFALSDVGYDALPAPDSSFLETEINGAHVALRPVTLGDVIAIEGVADPDAASALLLARISQGQAADLGTDLEAVNSTLEARDPLADIWLECSCPECGHDQSVAFDPVGFVAQELRQMAHRILQDVVDIARVFHWSERDVLALPEDRRAFYVSQALATHGQALA